MSDAGDERLLAELRAVWGERGDAPPRGAPDLARYRIVRRVGEGGMGVVWEAEQRAPRRRVALKIVRAELTSPRTLRRFADEAELLGRLDHPGIARVLETGTFDGGSGPQPFLVMELVRGLALDAYVDSVEPDLRARLDLLVQLCDAVHHAHQKRVIHRDLKPANVLVDAAGRVKVLDFGVARATDARAVATRATLPGQLVGTIAYMSPEQVAGRHEQIDTRADVYALGVVAYELLSGRLPHAPGASLTELARAIEETEPVPLGTRVPALAGDLEAVVAQALAKDPSRRYASAAALGDDLRRVLADEPVTARAPSALERAARFVRRQRVLVLAVAAVVGALGVGLVAARTQAARASFAEAAAQQAAGRARADARRARAASGFLVSVIEQAAPQNTAADDPSLRDVLEEAARRVERELGGDPQVEAEVRLGLGRAYLGLGDVGRARAEVERARTLRETAHPPGHPLRLAVETRLAGIALLDGRYDEAARWAEGVLAQEGRLVDDARIDVATSLNALAMADYARGRYERAPALLERALAVYAEISGPRSGDVGVVTGNLAMIHEALGDRAEAVRLHREAAAILTETAGARNPLVASNLNKLAHVLALEGEPAEAEEFARLALEIRRERLGDAHPDVASSLATLGRVRLLRGDAAGAEALLRHALALARAAHGERHAFTGSMQVALAETLLAQARHAEAEVLLREALASDLVPREALPVLALLLERTGRPEEADRCWQQVVDLTAGLVAPDHPALLELRARHAAFVERTRP